MNQIKQSNLKMFLFKKAIAAKEEDRKRLDSEKVAIL
jgi:hypothetical protein